MGEERHSEAELTDALGRLSEPGALDSAEQLVARCAPQLQRLLNQALEEGGWFGPSHAEEARKAVADADPEERERAVRVLLAEETRVGMMVGVAVGWALAEDLHHGADQPDTENEHTTTGD